MGHIWDWIRGGDELVHVILLILKVLGITLLILLGIVLLLVLLLLLAPFHYTIDAEYYGDVKAVGRIQWLCFVLDLKGVYGNNKFLYYLKSFGFMISTNDEEDKHYRAVSDEEAESGKSSGKAKASEAEKVPVKVVEDDFEAYEQELARKEQQLAENEQQETRLPEKHTEKAITKQESKPESEPQKKSIFMRIYEGIESGLEWVVTIPMRVHDKISELMARILDFFANLAENMNKVIKKRDMILQKITGVRSLLEKPYTKKVLKDGKVLLKKMWKHVRPRKLQGNIHFGLEDPATTGQLLGVVGMLYPVYRNHFVIAPDFEQQIFEGKIYAKGRVQIGRMTFLALRFMLTRDFFKTVQRARTIIGGN